MNRPWCDLGVEGKSSAEVGLSQIAPGLWVGSGWSLHTAHRVPDVAQETGMWFGLEVLGFVRLVWVERRVVYAREFGECLRMRCTARRETNALYR